MQVLIIEDGASLRAQMRHVEAKLIARALEEAGHNRRVAAARLGIGLSSLYRKIEELERLGLRVRAAGACEARAA
jgi:transcriptional regulator with PAS, ATPase and Fis domain